MPVTYETVIVDTSCLILLDKIGELQLLEKLFRSITIITDVIAKEFNTALPNWVSIKPAGNLPFQNSLELDPGEASAIALSLENVQSLLIIDDAKGRRTAKRLGLTITGTLGLFLKAKQNGLIPSIKQIIEKVQLTDFRFSSSVLSEILTISGEI